MGSSSFARSLSNTLIFDKRDCRGINIGFSETKIGRFRKLRPDNHNVVACFSDAVREVHVAHYRRSNTNRMSAGILDYESLPGEKPISTRSAQTTTLSDIITALPFEPEEISYGNIDCEGHDLDVFRGLDSRRCRPRVTAIEGWTTEKGRLQSEFLEVFGYRLNQFYSLVSLFGRADN
jgi:hypothetical protein